MKIKILFAIFIISLSVLPAQQEIFSKAMESYNYQDYSGAYNLFKNIIEKNPFENEVYNSSIYYAAQCLIALEQKDGAASLLNRFVKEHFASNFRDKALFQLGTLYYELGKYDAARETLLDIIDYHKESSHFGSANYWIGETYVKQGKLNEAFDYLTNAVTNSRKNGFVDYSLFSLASLYEREKQYTNAVNYYEQLSFHLDSKIAPHAQFRLGMCFYKMQEYDRAVLELSDPLIKKLPDEYATEAKLALSVTFAQLKEFQNAKQNYLSILDDNIDVKTENQIKYSLAWINFQTGDYIEAFRLFNLLSQLQDENLALSSLYWAAESKRYAGEEDASLSIYDDFLKKYPNSEYSNRAKMQKAIIFYNKNKFADAKNLLNDVLEFNDDKYLTKTLVLLGEIELNQKNFNSAIDNFKKAINSIEDKREQDYLRAKFGLGIAYYHKGEHKSAEKELLDLYNISKRFEPNKVLIYIAENYFALGTYPRAIEFYNRINTNEEPLAKNTLFGKASAYFNNKDFVNSTYYFNEFIKKYKKDVNYAEAYIRLAESYYGMKEFDNAAKIYS